MSVVTRPLSPIAVNLSLSESADSAGLGFPASELQRTFLRLVAMLLGQGARVVLGHDWRDDGVMESVSTYVERYRPTIDDSGAAPLISNVLPWPDKSRLSSQERKALEPSLVIKSAGLPPYIPATVRRNKRPGQSVRAFALSYLRVRLTESSNARICLGGRVKAFQGRLPGIVEEALFSVRARKPLYLVGLFGGATQVVIDALKGKHQTREFLQAPRHADVINSQWWQRLPQPYNERPGSTRADVFDELRKFGLSGLSKANRLTISENEQLFNIESVDEALDLVLSGMRRIGV